MNIRNYQPGDDATQAAIYNEAAGQLPKFKPANEGEVSPRTKIPAFYLRRGLEKPVVDNASLHPASVFVLRSRANDVPRAAGVVIDNPSSADPKQVDPAMPCFRLGAFGTEGMQTKRINGLFSFLCASDRDVNPLVLDLMHHATVRLEESDAGSLAAQVPSDAPHLLQFYQRYFRRQASFPVFEKAL